MQSNFTRYYETIVRSTREVKRGDKTRLARGTKRQDWQRRRVQKERTKKGRQQGRKLRRAETRHEATHTDTNASIGPVPNLSDFHPMKPQSPLASPIPAPHLLASPVTPVQPFCKHPDPPPPHLTVTRHTARAPP
jgi:hypothetical protein